MINHFNDLTINIPDLEDDGVLQSVIFGHNDTKAIVLFSLTFASSIVSGALGCTKAIKGGVAATMGDDGPFEGLCSGRFIVAFLGKFFVFIECAAM